MRKLIAVLLFSSLATPSIADPLTANAQRMLNQLGFDPGPVDGIMGGKTRTALDQAFASAEQGWGDTLDAADLEALRVMLSNMRPLIGQGVIVENLGGRQIVFPPVAPGVTRSRYAFGWFWVQADWNNDGRDDYLFTGTMVPDNANSTGEDTGGACGGVRCTGEMPGPTLFLQQSSGSFIERTDLFIDARSIPGQSLSRQNLVADFNGDGRLDLFIADHGFGTHAGIRDSYFLSQSDGTWRESSETHLSDSNYRIFDHGGAVGDIDGDGDMDIVLTELKDQLTCWMNDGLGKLRKAKCGSVNAFAIELADMDLDGDLDIVHAGHEYGGSTATGIAWNDGRGKFRGGIRLPKVSYWGTVPELSVWDLDRDGDADIVLSRAGQLYVGTGAQVIENLGGGQFGSQFFPLVEPPANFRAVHEGNEWNNFIDKILFSDVDGDGDSDIVFSGGGYGPNQAKVRGAILRNDGDMQFAHLANGARGNPVRVLSEKRFPTPARAEVSGITIATGAPRDTDNSKAFSNYLRSHPLQNTDVLGFTTLTTPVLFQRSGASVVGIANPRFEGNGGAYDLLIEWAGHEMTLSVCVDYYRQFDFTGTRVDFSGKYGFAGIESLNSFGTNGCRLTGGGAVGAWEIDDSAAEIGLKAFLEDLQENGRGLISILPGLSEPERAELLDVFR
jgi:hypothetical protein